MSEKYYLGLDVGTDSVGWAVTDTDYHLLKFHGEPMWGSVLFEAANLKAERRSFRTGRRRLNRKQQRVELIQELFAAEIAKVDPTFYKRMSESALYRNASEDDFTLFSDKEFTDRDYHKRYPTIHHLIVELMNSYEPHDVRLIYLACAWLVAHRGHFLSDVSKENIGAVTEFDQVYQELKDSITAMADDYGMPWSDEKKRCFETVLPKRISVSRKYRELTEALFDGGKVPKNLIAEGTFPCKCEVVLKALCGSKITAKDLFENEDYAEIDSFSLGSEDEVLAAIIAQIGEDGELIRRMKAVFDWSLLIEVLRGKRCISEAKIDVYEQHAKDLKTLKYFVRSYLPDHYNKIFRDGDENSYTAYVHHQQKGRKLPEKWSNKEKFSDSLQKLLKNLSVSDADQENYNDMVDRIAERVFLPKQKDTDNRVIPYQLYWYELDQILQHAKAYLPLLSEKDDKGMSVSEKILSVFEFRIPYYVGPLNKHSDHAWVVRKGEERIYPWNFTDQVDLDASENEFIRRMTNTCTYLAGEPCLPKESMMYRKFMVLNEINNIRINNHPISVELKQEIYQELFCRYRKVDRKKLEAYLLSNGYMEKGQEITGIDLQINAQLKAYHDFKRLIASGILTEEDAERIIERITYTDDKPRLRTWLRNEYSALSEDDVRYLSKLRYVDFGRLSATFLNGFEGASKDSGEVLTIMSALWNTNCNLMELLSDEYTFMENVVIWNKDYYQEHPKTLEERLNEMYISNAVKRPILRALEVVKEVSKAKGTAPERIFIEVARGAREDQKNKRTKTRKEQILELYKKCKDEDVRLLKQQLEEMGEMADNRLQGDALFLYYMQLGRSIYSGKPIDIDRLGTKLYDIDHIYPQRLVKDDSILNNKVLCLSEENGSKSDKYPVPKAWRQSMEDFWRKLNQAGLMTDEKFRRLTREEPFSETEQLGFINRQLTETTQSTKALAALLKEHYENTEVVYVKARLTSEFRNEFDMLKSRSFNDLHHAKDAYLNIVTGNVYHMLFNKAWFTLHQDYSLKTQAIFGKEGDKVRIAGNGEVVWDGSKMLGEIKKTVAKNNGHITVYSFCRHGGYYDQMPLRKGNDQLIPRKQELPATLYGGYNKTTASFFSLVKYEAGKEKDIIIMPVELLYAEKYLSDPVFAEEYAKKTIGTIRNKVVSSISFPLGKRPLKINTVFSLDGFRVSLSGKSGGGKQLIMSPLNPFSANNASQNYLHHIDTFVEKCNRNSNLLYDADHDKVNKADNIQLYDLYIDKLTNSIYRLRPNNPLSLLINSRDRFSQLDVMAQTKVLQSVHSLFGRASGGTDLSMLGGAAKAGVICPASTLSNWKKNYSNVYIIDCSSTGMWEKKTGNLLELL